MAQTTPALPYLQINLQNESTRLFLLGSLQTKLYIDITINNSLPTVKHMIIT